MKDKYTYIILKGENDQLIATIPELPGIVAQGADEQQLQSRINDAILLYIKTLQKEKLYTPRPLELIDVKVTEVSYE